MKKINTLFFAFLSLTSLAQIENGMVFHAPFNNNLLDVSTSQATIINNNAAFGTDRNGVSNFAANFNNNGYVSVTDDVMKQQFPVTISFWLNLNSLSNVNVLFKTDNVFSNHYGIWMNNLPSGGLTLSFGGGLGTANSSNQRYYTTNDVITANSWHHIVGIIRSYNDMDIYIDCIKTTGSYGGTGLTNVAYSATGEARIGGCIGNSSSPGDFYVDGKMDQFAFWNRELTPSEITYLCDLNNTLAVDEEMHASNSKVLVKIVDMMGREIEANSNVPCVYIYSDGTTEKRFVVNF